MYMTVLMQFWNAEKEKIEQCSSDGEIQYMMFETTRIAGYSHAVGQWGNEKLLDFFRLKVPKRVAL